MDRSGHRARVSCCASACPQCNFAQFLPRIAARRQARRSTRRNRRRGPPAPADHCPRHSRSQRSCRVSSSGSQAHTRPTRWPRCSTAWRLSVRRSCWSWAAEVARLDISAGLAIAVLAFIAVLPEYAVDLVFAMKGGNSFEANGFTLYRPGPAGSEESPALARACNMTGANRLLIGVGWTLVVFLAWRQFKKRGAARGRQADPTRSLARRRALVSGASPPLYSLFIAFRCSITLVDAAILVSLFIAYTIRISWAPAERTTFLVGPAKWIGTFSVAKRRTTVIGLFIFAGCGDSAGGPSTSPKRSSAAVSRSASANFCSCSGSPRWRRKRRNSWWRVCTRLRLNTNNALGTLVSSKVNQWMLLVGTLPIAFAIASASNHGLPDRRAPARGVVSDRRGIGVRGRGAHQPVDVEPRRSAADVRSVHQRSSSWKRSALSTFTATSASSRRSSTCCWPRAFCGENWPGSVRAAARRILAPATRNSGRSDRRRVRPRRVAWRGWGNETFDVLIIGGGITGGGRVALDAATRGLSVALVDKGDLVLGTSSKSSKLVHGGLRYLQQREVRLVYENLWPSASGCSSKRAAPRRGAELLRFASAAVAVVGRTPARRLAGDSAIGWLHLLSALRVGPPFGISSGPAWLFAACGISSAAPTDDGNRGFRPGSLCLDRSRLWAGANRYRDCIPGGGRFNPKEKGAARIAPRRAFGQGLGGN